MRIVLPAETADERALWYALMDLADRSRQWTLIGARMVELHAAAADRRLSRMSLDANVLADARKPLAIRRVAQILFDDDFELEEPSAMGVGHTFKKNGVEIDLLAPEHLGLRSQRLRTTVPGARTIEVPGGRQALARSRRVRVRVGRMSGEIPRPDLLGAILIKTRAVEVDDAPESQRADLALLLSLVNAPEELTGQMAGQERRWLRRRREMDDADASCWRALRREQIRTGIAALRHLAGWGR